jgi:hypothetical protein
MNANDELFVVVSLSKYLNQTFKLPPNDDYNRGYNDALLDMKNEILRISIQVSNLNNKQ